MFGKIFITQLRNCVMLVTPLLLPFRDKRLFRPKIVNIFLARVFNAPTEEFHNGDMAKKTRLMDDVKSLKLLCIHFTVPYVRDGRRDGQNW